LGIIVVIQIGNCLHWTTHFFKQILKNFWDVVSFLRSYTKTPFLFASIQIQIPTWWEFQQGSLKRLWA
jgi:hypothetical protein